MVSVFYQGSCFVYLLRHSTLLSGMIIQKFRKWGGWHSLLVEAPGEYHRSHRHLEQCPRRVGSGQDIYDVE